VYNGFELTLFLIDGTFDLANTSLLSLKGIGRETLKTLIDLFLLRASFGVGFGYLLNCDERYW